MTGVWPGRTVRVMRPHGNRSASRRWGELRCCRPHGSGSFTVPITAAANVTTTANSGEDSVKHPSARGDRAPRARSFRGGCLRRVRPVDDRLRPVRSTSGPDPAPHSPFRAWATGRNRDRRAAALAGMVVHQLVVGQREPADRTSQRSTTGGTDLDQRRHIPADRSFACPHPALYRVNADARRHRTHEVVPPTPARTSRRRPCLCGAPRTPSPLS
jgi:hypothetical protein